MTITEESIKIGRKIKLLIIFRPLLGLNSYHELIRTLRLVNGKSLRETARLAGVSKMTVIRVCNNVEE